jgi:hypothetical protein
MIGETEHHPPACPVVATSRECPLATEDSIWSAAARESGRLAGGGQRGPYV